MQRDYKLSSYSLNSVSSHFLSEQVKSFFWHHFKQFFPPLFCVPWHNVKDIALWLGGNVFKSCKASLLGVELGLNPNSNRLQWSCNLIDIHFNWSFYLLSVCSYVCLCTSPFVTYLYAYHFLNSFFCWNLVFVLESFSACQFIGLVTACLYVTERGCSSFNYIRSSEWKRRN